jgi:hypothetical protein
VAEMNTGLQQLHDSNLSHFVLPFICVGKARTPVVSRTLARSPRQGAIRTRGVVYQ